MYTSKPAKIPEVTRVQPCYKPTTETFKDTSFTPTESIVIHLVRRLQDHHPELPFGVVVDNFFTTHKLFAELRQIGVGAIGTAKNGSGIPHEFIKLRDCTTKEKQLGKAWNVVAKEGVNMVAFIDSTATFMMTTLHDFATDTPRWRPAIKRKGGSLEYAQKIDEKGDDSVKNMKIPYYTVSYDYNHTMGGSDIASQIWSYYTTAHHSHRRSWWPLLWQLLDATVANIYAICSLSDPSVTHAHIQTLIGLAFLQDPRAVCRKRRRSFIVRGQSPSKASPSTSPDMCTWENHYNRIWCRGCGPRPHGRGRERGRQPLGDITNRPRKHSGRKKTNWRCSQCKVGLCHSQDCWDEWHNIRKP